MEDTESGITQMVVESKLDLMVKLFELALKLNLLEEEQNIDLV